MNIKTQEGTSTGMPLSDIQTYNKYLKSNTIAVWSLIVLIIVLFAFSFYYVKAHGIVGYPIRLLETIAQGCGT